MEAAPPGTCCFNSSGVSVHSIAGGHNLLVIDGFFCEPVLQLARRVAAGAKEIGLMDKSTNVNYPGDRFSWSGTFVRDDEVLRMFADSAGIAGEESMARLRVLLSGRWLRCLEDAADMAGMRFTESLYVAERELAESAERNLVAADGTEKTLGIFSRTTSPQTHSPIHIDDNDIVVNVHLAPGLEETGTAFYRTREGGREICTERGDPVFLCNGSVHAQALFVTRYAKRLRRRAKCTDREASCAEWAAEGQCFRQVKKMYTRCAASCGVCQGFWPGPHVPLGGDYSGRFEMHHVAPFVQNRATVYSGNLPHGSWYSEDSIDRVRTDNVLSGRLLLGLFLQTRDRQPTYPLLIPDRDAGSEAEL